MRGSYHQAYQDYFWQWEEGGDVLAIPGGSTIAYKKEIIEILEKIGTEGIPKFGSLLLALIAINPKGKSNLDFVFKQIENKKDSTFPDAKNFLITLTQIPEQYKTGKSKTQVLNTIFKNSHNCLSSIKLASILHQLRLLSIENASFRVSYNPKVAQKEIQIISLLNRKFPTPQSIVDALIGLPEIDEELILETTLETEPKELIDELILDARTQKVGTLVKTIWASINLPFHSSIPSQQPIGGVSDLSNKGTFDQMLVSEYANDDVIFLSRLANNEVLFLNRESPPTTNELTRVLLIDISLKNWGIPKIISFATMLAIVKHPKSKIDCQVFVIGNALNKVETNSLKGIVDGLEFVEACLNAGIGLKKFFENNPPTKGREVFVLTERTTPLQNTFYQAIGEYTDQIDYWIYTDAEGKIDLYKKSKRSKKHLQHLELPLNRLWSIHQKEKDKAKNKTNDKLEDFYPILVAKSVSNKGIRITHNGEIFLLDNRKNILRLYAKQANSYEQAWDIFYQNIPNTNGEFEVGLLKNGDYVILTVDRSRRLISLINCRSKEIKQVAFGNWKWKQPANFVFDEDKFFHFNGKRLLSVDLNGAINETTQDFIHFFEKRAKEIKEAELKYNANQPILTNIKRVAVNSLGNLVINNFELNVHDRGNIELKLAHSTAITTQAQKQQSNTFKFNDGSTVELHQPGLVVLKSSNKNIPTIYFPSIIDGFMSIATLNTFAGTARYRKSPKYELILQSHGDKPHTAIKILKKFTDFGLHELKTKVDSMPHNLHTYFSEEEAIKAKNELAEIGAKAEIIETYPGFSELETIEPKLFFEQHVTPFVNTILSYGTKN